MTPGLPLSVDPLRCAPAGAPAARAPGRWLALLLELSKARITFAVTFSVATGWVLATGSLSWPMLAPVLGVFLLSCGSACINQVQEWRTDLRMPRTRGRPIPSGRISARGALAVALTFLALGLLTLAQVAHQVGWVLGLGVFAVLYYNGAYWWLKRATAFAIVPGSIIGAVPPVLGWCAAGGAIDAPRILEVAAFFFLWQIPHFWLLLHMYGRQYLDAGLPSPTGLVGAAQFQRITVQWALLTAVLGLVLVVRHGLALPWTVLALAASVALTVAVIAFQRGAPDPLPARRLFMRLNFYALAMMLLLMADALAR